MKVKDIIIIVAIVLLVGGLTGCIIALVNLTDNKPKETETGAKIVMDDGSYLSMKKNADSLPDENLVYEYYLTGVTLHKADQIGFKVDGQSVSVYTDNASKGIDLTTADTALYKILVIVTGTYDIYLKNYKSGVWTVYMSTDQVMTTADELSIKPAEQSAMRLNASRTVASGNTYTLTATVQPDDATDKAVSWDIAWNDPNSSWASGKAVSNYVTLSSNENTATVTLKAAFGERAIITVSSESDPDVTATCTVDYIERLNIPHGNGYMDINRIYQNNNTDQVFVFGTTMNIKADVRYSGVGTVRGIVEFGRLSLEMSEDMKSYITGQVSGSNYKYTTKSLSYSFSSGLNTTVNIGSPTEFFSFMGDPSETSGKLTNAFIAACKMGYKIRFSTQFTYSYDGNVIQSGQAIGNFSVNTNGLAIAATGVSIDSSSIEF